MMTTMGMTTMKRRKKRMGKMALAVMIMKGMMAKKRKRVMTMTMLKKRRKMMTKKTHRRSQRSKERANLFFCL